MRRNKTLLKVLLKNVGKIERTAGLCALIQDLLDDRIISLRESWAIGSFIRDNRPSFNKAKAHLPYYWKPYSISSRREFLERLIKELEK